MNIGFRETCAALVVRESGIRRDVARKKKNMGGRSSENMKSVSGGGYRLQQKEKRRERGVKAYRDRKEEAAARWHSTSSTPKRTL